MTAPGHPDHPAGPTAALRGALPEWPGTNEPDIWDSHLSIDGSLVLACHHRAASLVARATAREGRHLLVVTEAEDERPGQVPRLPLVLPAGRTTAGPGNSAHSRDDEEELRAADTAEAEPTSPMPCGDRDAHRDDWARQHLAWLLTRPEEPPDLAPRLLEVLQLAADGDADAQIAAKLFLSANTIKSHLTRT